MTRFRSLINIFVIQTKKRDIVWSLYRPVVTLIRTVVSYKCIHHLHYNSPCSGRKLFSFLAKQLTKSSIISWSLCKAFLRSLQEMYKHCLLPYRWSKICGLICVSLMMGTLIIFSLISHCEHVIAFIEFPSGDTIAREVSHPTMSQFTNSSNFTVLLGFSPNKCGSSHFSRVIELSLSQLENPESVTKRSVFKLVRPLSGAYELKFWSLCVIPSWIARAHNKYVQPYYPGKWSLETRGCSMESYLHKFASNLSTLHSMTKERHVYLMEKDTQYIRYYHSIMTLSIYAHSFPLYFYISLRNPTTRLWSHYWHQFQYVYNSSDPQSVQQLMDQIEYEMDVFPQEHPKYQQVFDALSLQYGDHIDEVEVVRLWKDAMYDLGSNLYAERPHSLRGVQHWGDFAAKAVSPVGMPVFAVSCYYPQILTLYHALEGWLTALGYSRWNGGIAAIRREIWSEIFYFGCKRYRVMTREQCKTSKSILIAINRSILTQYTMGYTVHTIYHS